VDRCDPHIQPRVDGILVALDKTEPFFGLVCAKSIHAAEISGVRPPVNDPLVCLSVLRVFKRDFDRDVLEIQIDVR